MHCCAKLVDNGSQQNTSGGIISIAQAGTAKGSYGAHILGFAEGIDWSLTIKNERFRSINPAAEG